MPRESEPVTRNNVRKGLVFRNAEHINVHAVRTESNGGTKFGGFGGANKWWPGVPGTTYVGGMGWHCGRERPDSPERGL